MRVLRFYHILSNAVGSPVVVGPHPAVDRAIVLDSDQLVGCFPEDANIVQTCTGLLQDRTGEC